MPRMRKDWEQEYRDLAKEARRLAKRANQRMLRLERYSKEKAYRGALDFSYDIAQKNIKALYGKQGEKLRFTENQKLVQVSDGTKNLTGADLYQQNVYMLRHKINAMKEFLESESSTKKGLKSVYDKRAHTISTAEKFGLSDQGLSLTSNDLQRFFDSKKQKKLAKMVGSLNMFVVAAVMEDHKLGSNKKDLVKFLKENIDLKALKDADRDPAEIDNLSDKSYKSYKDMIDDLWEFVHLTDDPILDEAIGEALKAGINYKNIFI